MLNQREITVVSKSCSNCEKKASALFYTTWTKALCRSCHRKSLTKKAALIKKLPMVVDKKAPLGYELVGNCSYHNQEWGSAVAGDLFRSLRTGLDN